MGSWKVRLACGVVAGLLVACGGGGGGDAEGGGTSNYPTLVVGGSFSLPAPDALPDRSVLAGVERGQVLGAGSQPVTAATVELLDAEDPAAPRVLASASTGADGRFALDRPAETSAWPAARTWLRARLADGTVLRAYAAGWTALTPGTEAAHQALTRSLTRGALGTRVHTRQELADAQDAASLLWHGTAVASPPAEAAAAVAMALATQASWNQMLQRLAAATPSSGVGDVAGLLPRAAVQLQSSLVEDGAAARAVTVNQSCFDLQGAIERQCTFATPEQDSISEQWAASTSAVTVRSIFFERDVVTELFDAIGPLPLLEFPARPGEQVVVDRPRLDLASAPTVGANVRITRRIYAPQAVQALGTTVQAIPVVFDFEIAILDRSTGQQVDLLARERRWIAPGRGWVRTDGQGLVRAGGTVTPAVSDQVAIAGQPDTFGAAVLPLPAPVQRQTVLVQHRHAVVGPNSVFVAAEEGGGSVQRRGLDDLALQTSAVVGSTVRRVAVSADGSRVYLGVDGGRVIEFDAVSLTPRREFSLPNDPAGRAYDRVYDLVVDRFNPARIVLVAGSSQRFGEYGAVLVFVDGVLTARNAPGQNVDDFGWGRYAIAALAWSETADEYLATARLVPESSYRFRVQGDQTTELAALPLVTYGAWKGSGGRLIAADGAVYDAQTFQLVRQLALAPFALRRCEPLGGTQALCNLSTGGVDVSDHLVRFDAITGAYLGAYRADTNPADSCIGNPTRSAVDGSRQLVSVVAASGLSCSLQLWQLDGGS